MATARAASRRQHQPARKWPLRPSPSSEAIRLVQPLNNHARLEPGMSELGGDGQMGPQRERHLRSLHYPRHPSARGGILLPRSAARSHSRRDRLSCGETSRVGIRKRRSSPTTCFTRSLAFLSPWWRRRTTTTPSARVYSRPWTMPAILNVPCGFSSNGDAFASHNKTAAPPEDIETQFPLRRFSSAGCPLEKV